MKSLNKIQEKNQRQFDLISSQLTRLSADERIPEGLVGDVHDLKVTLEKTIDRLNSMFFLKNGNLPEELTRDSVFALELMIEEELGWIVSDILSGLKSLRESGENS